MANLFHSESGFKPRIIPVLGNVDWAEIDRAQNLDPDVTLPREKVEELGNSDIVGWLKDISTAGCRLTQIEYGSMELFNILANKPQSTTSLSLDDFDNTYFDLLAFLTDTDDNHYATLMYPKQRLAGFSINIADPTAIISRSFNFVGEEAHLWQGNNKYVIFKKETLESGDITGSDGVITVSDPDPVEDPLSSGTYILRVVRVRGSSSTELTAGTDYTYNNSTQELTISNSQVGDIIKYWYTASSYISGSDPFTPNTSDLAGIRANSASLYIGTSDYLYRVQGATIDVAFTREDVREIGSNEVVLRGVNERTVTITLDKLVDTDFTLEELLANASNGQGHIKADDFGTDLVFICAIYDSSSKSNFKIGYKATGLAVTSWKPGTGAVNTHVASQVVLEGTGLTITNSLATLGI